MIVCKCPPQNYPPSLIVVRNVCWFSWINFSSVSYSWGQFPVLFLFRLLAVRRLADHDDFFKPCRVLFNFIGRRRTVAVLFLPRPLELSHDLFSGRSADLFFLADLAHLHIRVPAVSQPDPHLSPPLI